MPIIVMPPMPQNVIQGSTAAFSCEVTSIPRATITWYREVDGVEESLQTGMPVNVAINLSQVMDNSVTSNLVVMDSQLIDIANYRCRASHLESGITGMAASNTALLDIYGKCGRIVNEDHMVWQHGLNNLQPYLLQSKGTELYLATLKMKLNVVKLGCYSRQYVLIIVYSFVSVICVWYV